TPADQQWMKDTESVGSFSDDFRNELKSGFGSEGEPRFLTGGARTVQQIFDNVTAKPHNFLATNPGDVVPYIAVHDNLKKNRNTINKRFISAYDLEMPWC